MKKYVCYLLFVCFYCLLACTSSFDSEVLDPTDITRLIPLRGELGNGVELLEPDSHYKTFWAKNWKKADQYISWKVNAEHKDYIVDMLVCVEHLEVGEEVKFILSNGTDSVSCLVRTEGWQRCRFDRPLHFCKGTSVLFLKLGKLGKRDDFEVNLYSLEVFLPDTYERLQAEAKSLRSNTSWMADLPYGFFFHWNSKSMPQQGEPLPYEEAVNNFDVERFAQTVYDCGGRLVFFTTTWAEYFFPAPIQAIDSILPGRTTKRDLVADLSNALGKYGIRLILYYHVGHGDKEWWSKQNYTRDHAGDLFTNVEKIVGEISQRYGKRLVGLWMDDGIGYYPNGASFERIAQAAKSGNKDLVICFNSWILPKLTDFQDYYAGELGLSLESAGVDSPYLSVEGDGVFHGGPQDGLQATFSGTLEPGDWTHIYKDSVIGSPCISIDELEQVVKESNRRKNLPMINVRIYQDGTISPKSKVLLQELNRRIAND